MRDPVAEILAERAATGSGLASAVVLSLLLHAGGTALAVYAGMHKPPPRRVNAVSIRFAQAPRVAPAAALSPAAPVPSAVPSPSPIAPPEPAAPRIEEPRPQPLTPTKAAQPPAKNTAPPSPFGRSAKKAGEVPPAPPRAVPSAPGGTGPGSAASSALGGEIGVGQTGVTGLEGGDFPYTIYLEQMKRLIGSRWVRPDLGEGARTVVYFRIQRDGTVGDVEVLSRSGSGSFDRAAERAVREASPLPPLPFGYSGPYLGVHLTFR